MPDGTKFAVGGCPVSGAEGPGGLHCTALRAYVVHHPTPQRLHSGSSSYAEKHPAPQRASTTHPGHPASSTANAYWCHPEAVLLAMACDTDPQVRQEAVRRIMQARADAAGEEGVRPYTQPRVNFAAQRIQDIVMWDSIRVTEPPLLSHLTDEEVQGLRVQPHSVPAYPVHTQAVERYIRQVTRASTQHLLISAKKGGQNSNFERFLLDAKIL